MLLTSVVSVFYQLNIGLRVMAHNHSEYRHNLLDTSRQQADHVNALFGLTRKDLSLCDRYVAEAYTASVSDGFRLATGYDTLDVQCLALSALLFLTSILGIRSVGKRLQNKGG